MTRAEEYRSLGGPRPLTFAHRGGAGLWPENTIEAFRGAVRLGCSHLETDLRMSRDGEIVLMHDERLERTTNGTGLVARHTLRELKALDAGYRFTRDGHGFPERGRGHQIATFDELVSECPASVCFNVEIKERSHADLPRALWDFIRRRDLADRIVVAAERHELLRDFRRRSGTRVATSASRRECLMFWLASRAGVASWMKFRFQALQIPVHVKNWRFLTPELLAAAHRLGMVVHVWTIDDVAEMQHLLDLGVDGLMSDYPDRLLGVVRERAL